MKNTTEGFARKTGTGASVELSGTKSTNTTPDYSLCSDSFTGSGELGNTVTLPAINATFYIF